MLQPFPVESEHSIYLFFFLHPNQFSASRQFSAVKKSKLLGCAMGVCLVAFLAMGLVRATRKKKQPHHYSGVVVGVTLVVPILAGSFLECLQLQKRGNDLQIA